MVSADDVVAGPKREELNRRLIKVARAILEKDGLEGLTLRAAARSAGVSHMAPYRHYESKDDLLAAVAEEAFKDLTGAMDRSADCDAPPKARLQGLCRAYLKFALANPALYRLMFGANLPNRSRFPGLVAACKECCARCVAVVGPEVGADGENLDLPRKAIATWSFVHGLASLAIDGLVPLPEHGDPAFLTEIDALIAAADLHVENGKPQ